MDYQKLADLLFPDLKFSPTDYEQIYPQRQLAANAKVTRIGPSPTGFIHLGNLYNAIIGDRLAHQSNGVFFLRIEDTDSKREVAGAVEIILSALGFFGINFDEGATIDGDNGNYGPYRQSQRKDIYHCFAKQLVKMGKAYPCFCSEEELTQMREEQMAKQVNFGYYSEWARDRNNDYQQIAERIAKGEPYVLRFRSDGNIDNTVILADAIRGELQLQENYQDFVLLKSDGIPTYHFAHVVDDHLMRSTHVIRSEEWLATAPIHLQLFDTFGWQRPIYCHTAQLMKLEDGNRRKLSKRKDPELALKYYCSEGYLPEAIWEYLLTVLNSNFEEWRMTNPSDPFEQFPFTIEKMSNSGTLFDLDKLQDISKEILVRTPAAQIYDFLKSWAEKYNPTFSDIFCADKEYSLRVIDVNRSGDRPRKDLVYWKQAIKFLSFYFDELFTIEDNYPENIDSDTACEILNKYLETLDFNDDQEQWFNKVREITDALGFAVQPKKYRKNPELYRGSIIDVSNTIRVAITGRLNSPDLWEISNILGDKRVRNRVQAAIKGK